MNSAVVLVAVVLTIVLAVPFDLYVARECWRGAIIPPRIPLLTAIAIGTTGIALSAIVAAVVAVAGLYLLLTGVRLLPPGLGTFLVSIALLGFSVGNIPLLLLLREWSRERRAGGRSRRRDDPPEQADPEPVEP